ncbi:MAG TPA: IS1634 family transposase [Smithella sp.]|nr:IS1634 family transposase [Smithella sp.]
MYIRRTTHADKKNKKEYHTFKLIESVRTERGPRQRMLLNLGTDFSLPEDRWKDLANRIEEIITGQDALFAYPADIENLAVRYARKVIDYQGEPGGGGIKSTDPDYHRVDIDTIDNERSRSAGAEHVIYETIKSLGINDLLMALGFNKPALDAAIGVIAARLIAPSSERATHLWLQEMSAMDELLGADFTDLSQDRVYKTSDLLLRHKKQIEDHLCAKECRLFNLEEKIILYDLTNTFFEGSGRYNGKAHFGPSKEKRSDCPLVTLGMVLDADGFPKRTEVFAGNVSEPGTLEGMIKTLAFADMFTRPLIVMDAGIATQSNILWLKEKGFDYIVVSRKKRIDLPLETEMITVREDNRRLIRAAITKGPDDDEVTLYCHSTDKEIKERGIKNLFESRFEEKLEQIRNALSKKHGTKVYEKVVEKIGRLKERYKRISSRYEIAVTKDENTNWATTIAWERKEQEKPAGVYCLRSNRIDFKEQELFNIFAMLTDIEDAFRSMKSELGMRPVYHQNENRTDGHLFITVLAYHILHSIRVHLRSQGVNDCWTTVRKRLSTHVRITTTMKRDDGKSIHIRKSTRPEAYHKIIYDALQLSPHPGITIKTIL